jgi:hypothetical protein
MQIFNFSFRHQLEVFGAVKEKELQASIYLLSEDSIFHGISSEVAIIFFPN